MIIDSGEIMYSKDCVYVVILNYNGSVDTKECVASVIKSDYPRVRVIVVDNKSTDQSFPDLARWLDDQPEIQRTVTSSGKNTGSAYFGPRFLEGAVEVCLVQSARNGGYAYGSNIGIQIALSQPDCSHVWLLNNDTVVFPETLAGLLRRYEQTELAGTVGIVGCIQRYYRQPDVVQAWGGGFDRWKVRVWNEGDGSDYAAAKEKELECDYVNGACMLISRTCLLEVGLFSESYFMYFEELDYAARAVRSGYVARVSPEVSILHKHRASISNLGEAFREFHFRLSALRFYSAHYCHLLPIAFVKIVAIAVKNVITNPVVGRAQLRAVWKFASQVCRKSM
jgi:GT2 family glycosyltransferase